MANTTLPMAFLGGVSSYGLYISYQNITRLRQYEEQTKKAAEWSNTAAHRLHKTRTTQTSGTLSLLASLVTTLAIPFIRTPTYLALTAFGNAAAIFFSRTHMANFWNAKNQVRVPFVEKFNEATRGSQAIVGILSLLCWGWFVAGFLWFVPVEGLLAYSLSFGASVGFVAPYALSLRG